MGFGGQSYRKIGCDLTVDGDFKWLTAITNLVAWADAYVVYRYLNKIKKSDLKNYWP